MPELPEMQALAERLDARLTGAARRGVVPIGVAALKTAGPPPEVPAGAWVRGAGRRGTYLVVDLDDLRPGSACGTGPARVSYEASEITGCPGCQTGRRVLADRRRSRFLR